MDDVTRRELLRGAAVLLAAAGASCLAWGPASAAPAGPPPAFGSPTPRAAAAGRPRVPGAGDIRTPLRRGATGASVRTLQRRLAEQGYWVGRVTGSFGLTTQQAVMAFQKVTGLPRTGVLDARTWRKLKAGARPRPRTKQRGRVIEVSRGKQILMVIDDGRVSMILNTSTGRSGWTTPSGSWRFGRQIDRWHTAPLGRLYRPKFFHRGFAVHGSLSIPGYPASHGCCRVSVPAMDMLWGRSGIRRGDRIVVY